MNAYLKSLADTFREANALNAEPARTENEQRIVKFEAAAETLAPFLP